MIVIRFQERLFWICHVLTEYLRTHQDNMADHNKHILFKTCVRMWLLYVVNAQEDHNRINTEKKKEK